MTEIHQDSVVSTLLWGEDGALRPLWRAVLFVVLGVVLLRLIQGALIVFVQGLPPAAAIGVMRLAQSVGLLLESWFLLSVFDRKSFRSLGLWFYPGWGRELLCGACMGAALMGCVVGTLAATRAVGYHGLDSSLQNPLAGLMSIGGVLFLAAAFEEIAFRGYGFQRLVDGIGRLGAVLVFSVLFGVVHLSNPGVTPLSTANTVLSGVLLAVAYLKTRALWLPIGLHWAWNFFLGPVFALPVSGVRFGALLRAEIAGPEWLSGGNYGPEGSIVLTVLCTAGIIWLWRTKWISPSPAMQEGLRIKAESG